MNAVEAFGGQEIAIEGLVCPFKKYVEMSIYDFVASSRYTS